MPGREHRARIRKLWCARTQARPFNGILTKYGEFMRLKIFLAAAAVLVFGIGVAVFAYTSTTAASSATAVSCCDCCGDSCPIKSAKVGAKTEAQKADHSSCCGDSCPMRSAKGHDGTAAHHDAKLVAKTDGTSHSCPMAAKSEGTAVKHHASTAAGEKGEHSCSCPCCAAKSEAKTVSSQN